MVIEHAKRAWSINTDAEGNQYTFCTCGHLFYKGDKYCRRANSSHEWGHKPDTKKAAKRFSGASRHQQEIGGFTQSGHS